MKNCSLVILFFYFFSFNVNSQSKSWDRQDLSVTKFRNGEDLFFAQSDQDWEKASDDGIPAYCYYDGDPANGVLYNWFAVNDSRGLAPNGWLIPTKEDFVELKDLFKTLKSPNGGWNSKVYRPSNYNFNSNGYRTFESGTDFYSKGYISYFWSSSKVTNNSMKSYSFVILDDTETTNVIESYRENGYSVRCVKGDTDQSKLSVYSGQKPTSNPLLKAWDREDLNVTKFRNGEDVFFAQTSEEWTKASEDGLSAYCIYAGDESKGFLYNWFAVNDPRGLVPFGWRVPSKGDFDNLIRTSKEINYNQGGKSFALELKYNGYRTYDGFDFYSFGEASYLWTTTKVPNNSFESFAFELVKDQQLPMLKNERRENGYSIRCIRNYDEEIMGLPPSEIVGKSTICVGEEITLKTAGGELNENSKWVWYQNGAKIGEGESISVKPAYTTSYSVRAESSKGKFSDFVKKEIQVNSRPVTPNAITFSSNVYVNSQGRAIICEDALVTFSVKGELSQGSSWKWTENGKVVSTQAIFSEVIKTNSTIYVEAVNAMCGNSGFISKEIVVLNKTVTPISIYETSISFNKSKLYFETGALGANAEWKWYKVKKNGKLKYLSRGTEITINSFKTKKYLLQAEGGLCDGGPRKFEYQFNKNAKPIGGADWNKKYANSTGIFHFGFDFGLDVHNLSDSIQVMDSIFNFRAKSYGINMGLSFHPIINEFFTLGTRTNFILDFGKIDNSSQFQQLFPQSTMTKTPTFVLSKSSVGGELLIGILPKGKLKLLIDYDLANYRTVKSFGDSTFTSYRLVKKETTGIGFRIGSYAKSFDKNAVQLDVLYSLSNFNETPLFDFSQSMFSNPSHLRSGVKLRMWVHNAIKLEAGLIYSLNPITLKNDFNTKNAIVNFGLVWSFDRFY